MSESLGLTSHKSSCNCTGCGMLRAGVQFFNGRVLIKIGQVGRFRFRRQSRQYLLILSLSAFDPGCVKTLRGITAPGILGSVVMRRAKKTQKFVFRSASRPNQISFSHRSFKCLARTDICEFESHQPSHAVGLCRW